MNAVAMLDSDPGLLARLRAHGAEQREAFAGVFTAHRSSVLALCLHITGSASEAEDALQETFLAVHGALPAFRGEAKLSTWIHRIAIRVAFRVCARRGPHLPPQPEPISEAGEAEILARERSRRLLAALAELPAEHRVVVSLCALEGLSHREVAEILEIPVGTVGSRLHLARRKLAEALERP